VKAHDDFDVVGHLTYVCKSPEIPNRIPIYYKDYQEIGDEIMKVLVSKGKGMEINTSSIAGPYGKPIPGLDQLKLFRQLGGEIITIGSDAHVPENVGFGGDLAREMMKEAGFKYVAFYESRKPQFMSI
jgi:histidinol-phosphatase (PHP family)